MSVFPYSDMANVAICLHFVALHLMFKHVNF